MLCASRSADLEEPGLVPGVDAVSEHGPVAYPSKDGSLSGQGRDLAPVLMGLARMGYQRVPTDLPAGV